MGSEYIVLYNLPPEIRDETEIRAALIDETYDEQTGSWEYTFLRTPSVLLLAAKLRS